MSGFGLVSEAEKHWKGMPVLDQDDLAAYQSVHVHFRNPSDREDFSRLIDRKLSDRTRSIWYPREEIGRMSDKRFVSVQPLNPRYPVYVPSKGRWDSCYTQKALDKIGVPYKTVVEPQEYDEYAKVIDPKKILVLPHRDEGLVVTRNWIWDHAQESGVERFWTIDDNVQGFYRLYRNIKTPMAAGNIFRAMEDFVERYGNVPIAGMNYFMFIKRKITIDPFRLNVRVYSNMLIQTDARDPNGVPYRNEGFYNDDTDLCLRVLKDGFCTILFNAFLIFKSTTMVVKGGMTPYYQGDGRYKMAKELQEKHPDVTKITRKWGRWQHHVNYKPFRKNRLKLREDAVVPEGSNDYGMYLQVDTEQKRLLLIGQAPSKNGDPSKPLGGKIGKKLAAGMDVSFDRYLQETERMNLFDEWTGKNGKGDAWDADLARERADGLSDLLRGRKVLFVGRNAATAFGQLGLPWLTWENDMELDAQVAVMPHPSGIVLWWNDKENKAAARKFLRGILDCSEEIENPEQPTRYGRTQK